MQFQAKVMVGERVEAMQVEASTADEARHYVASMGWRLLALERAGGTSAWRARGGRFNLPVFNQQLHSLLDAGQPVVDAIDILAGNDRAFRHQAVYQALLNSLRHGRQLSDAMAAQPGIFPPLYVAMLRSSETTGSIRASISRYMQYQRQLDDIRGKLLSAAIYPAILVAVGSLVIAFLLLYVVPRFSAVFDDVSTRGAQLSGFIQAWGGFVRTHPGAAWAGFALIGAAIALLLLHPAPRSWLLQRLLASPWLGERLKVLQLARLYRTLGLLLRSGLPLLSAIRLTEGSLPANLQPGLRRTAAEVSEGKPLSMVMAGQALGTEVAYRLLVAGESSGNLDEMMERIADFYDQEVASWIDLAGRLIEPILMVGIGLVIGAVVLMLYIPIFDLANAIQ